jgi:hypothetical protein
MDKQKYVKRFLGRIVRVAPPAEVRGRVQGACWRYDGSACGSGGAYRQAFFEGRKQMAHRIMWKLFIDADLPDEDDLDHLCRTPACVNPAHLDPVPHWLNMHRSPTHFTGVNAARMHCPAGHLYDAANTHVTRGGGRVCRACRDARVREYMRRHPDANRAACQRYQEKKRQQQRAGGS